MTSGDFDFFGKPTTPPPSGAPSAGQFGAPAAASAPGAPAVNQFGMPVAPSTNQFGMPPTAPLRPAAPVQSSGIGGQLGAIAGIVAAIVLVTGGFLWLQAQGKKTATKVANTVESPIVKAHQIAETSDLQQAVQSEETYLADHSGYATSMSQLSGFMASPSTKITVVSATATTFCLRADDVSSFHAPSMYVSNATDGASPTPCT